MAKAGVGRIPLLRLGAGSESVAHPYQSASSTVIPHAIWTERGDTAVTTQCQMMKWQHPDKM